MALDQLEQTLAAHGTKGLQAVELRHSSLPAALRLAADWLSDNERHVNFYDLRCWWAPGEEGHNGRVGVGTWVASLLVT